MDNLSGAPSSIVNWEVDESGINRPRAGLVSHSVTGLPVLSPVTGLAHWKNYLIATTENRKIWAIADGTPNHASAASTSSTDTQLEGGAPRTTFARGDLYVYMAGGGRIQRWAPSIGASEVLEDSPRCTHIVTLDQYLIANDIDAASPSSVRWSEIGEGAWTSWPAANVMNADARPDPVSAIYENAGELYIFGAETLQVHALGPDPTFPFERVNVTDTGIGAPYAFCRLDQQVAFMDNRLRIVIGDGRSVEHISQAIQKDIRGFADVSDCWLFREERAQYSYIVVRFPSAGRTFVYDLLAKRWRERDYYATPFHADWPVTAHAYWPAQNYNILGSSLSSGGLMRLDEDTRQDVSAPLVCEMTTGWQEFGTGHKKKSARLRVTMRRGTAAENATPGALELRVQTENTGWSPWRQISVGNPHQYDQVQDLYEFNRIFRRCRYGIRYSTTEDHSLVSVEDDVIDLEADEE